MHLWVHISISVTITLAVAGCTMLTFIKFWGKAFIEKRVAEKLKEKQHILDAELEKLKAANSRVNHIMLSLYDEELKTLKDLVGSIYRITSLIGTVEAKYKLGVLGSNALDNVSVSKASIADAFTQLTKNSGICSVFVSEELYSQIHEFICITQVIVIEVQRPNSQQVQNDNIEAFHYKSKSLINEIRKELVNKKRDSFGM